MTRRERLGENPAVRARPWQNLDVRAKAKADSSLLAMIRDARRIAIRAGSAPHRFTSLWAVVVGERVFVRSWSVKPRSWYRTLLVEPSGVLQVKEREASFRSVQTRSESVKAAVDQVYILKYDHPGDIPYVKEMTRAKSRATTTELVFTRARKPLAPTRGSERLRAAASRPRTGRARRARAASPPRSRA